MANKCREDGQLHPFLILVKPQERKPLNPNSAESYVNYRRIKCRFHSGH